MGHIELFEAIDAEAGRYLSFLADICAFEATAVDKKTLDLLVDYIENFACTEGFATRDMKAISPSSCALLKNWNDAS